MVTQQEVQGYLASLVAQSMYMEEGEIDEDELFSNFGLESVTLVKLIARMNEKYSTTIKPREFLKHQTLRDASRFVFESISATAATQET